MSVQFKQKCSRCRNNYVIVSTRGRRKPSICYDCQKKDMEGEIKDSALKELFDIPEEYYKKNSFLRSIKIGYLKYGSLTDKQVEAFRKSVQKMKEESSKEKNDFEDELIFENK